jgi:hypothetical protein
MLVLTIYGRCSHSMLRAGKNLHGSLCNLSLVIWQSFVVY